MKKLFYFIFLINIAAKSQSITFQKFYGGSGVDQGNAVQITNDGGYIITGTMDWNNFFIIKTDVAGDTLWTRIFSGGNATSVAQTVDGGYIILANSLGQGYEINLTKTDPNGIFQWSKIYGGTKDDIGYSVHQTNDGGYIISGYTESYGDGNKDVYMIKANSTGNFLWSKTFGGTGYDEGRFVQQTNDGGYVITGSNNDDVYLIKTNPIGDTLWTRTFGGTGYDEGWSIEQITDGGYIIGGISNSYDIVGYNQAYLVKTNSNGIPQWSKTYGNSSHDECYSVQQTNDGGYIFISRFVGNSKDVLLVKTNLLGDTIWTKVFGGFDEDFGYMVRQTADNGYIITGQSRGLSPGDYDIYLIKTDSAGNSGCNQTNYPINVISPTTIVTNNPTVVSSGGNNSSSTISYSSGCTVTTSCEFVGINEYQKNNLMLIYPNPFTTSTTLEVSDYTVNEKLFFELFDMYGKQISFFPIKEAKTLIERDNLSAGMYFCKVVSNNTIVATGKFIIQ